MIINSNFFSKSPLKTQRLLNRSFQEDLSGKSINVARKILGESLSFQADIYDVKATNGELHAARVRTASSALSRQGEVIGRLNILAMRASDGLSSSAGRSVLNQEAQQLIDELAKIGGARFNGKNIPQGDSLKGTLGVDVSYIDADGVTIANSLFGINLSSLSGANSALNGITGAMESVSQGIARLGATSGAIHRGTVVAQEMSANFSSESQQAIGVDLAKNMAKITAGQVASSSQVATQLIYQRVIANNILNVVMH